MSSVIDSEATINAFIDTIRPNFDYIITISAFSACLFTLFVLLLALSTKESRRRVVFRLNVLAICIALTTSILAGLSNGKAIIDPFNPVLTNIFIAASAFVTPPATLLKIFAFPFCVKCARAVFITLCIKNIIRSVTATATGVLVQDVATIWFRNPNIISEWTLQILDNMYSVSLFLYNLRVRARPLKGRGGIPNRIYQVFCVSVANFIFPVALNITLLIFVTSDHTLDTDGGLLLLINNYVTVIGVLCATIWFSRLDTSKEPPSDEILRLKLNLMRAPTSGGMRGGEMMVIGMGALTLDPWQV